MDRRIRKLERSDDPIDKIRLGRLRCKIEGCQEYEILYAEWGYDPNMMAQLINISLSHYSNITIAFADYTIINDLDEARQRLEYMIGAIAKCPRCEKPNDRDYSEDLRRELNA